jgi:tetratricopeptide (TPR) repeat protein
MADTSTTQSWKLLYETGRQALQNRKLQEAEQSFSAALQLAEDFAGGDPRLAATLNALARIYSLQRRYLAAAALLNRLLEVTERTLGPSHVQVAGVLTNLAEMYTHLGAAREELELRERVLSIRADDPNADATSLQRLHDRVDELRVTLAQEAPAMSDDDSEFEALPIIRTAEYSAPAQAARTPEPVVMADAAVVQDTVAVVDVETPTRAVREDAFRMSPAEAQLSIAPWPGTTATGTTPTGGKSVEMHASATAVAEVATPSSPTFEIIRVPAQPSMSFAGGMDHGFSDMGRDELQLPAPRRFGKRSSLYSIAAGVVLVAGLIAARSYVTGSDDPSVSGGSVNLASVATPRPVVVTPVASPAAVEPEPRTVERLIADQRAEREARRAAADAPNRDMSEARAPRIPSAADIERTLRSLDGAAKAIDLRTKAATDSASALRLQTPTFKKVRVADP